MLSQHELKSTLIMFLVLVLLVIKLDRTEPYAFTDEFKTNFSTLLSLLVYCLIWFVLLKNFFWVALFVLSPSIWFLAILLDAF